MCRTDGRKSKDTGEVDEDGNPIKLEDVEKEGDGEIGDEGMSDTRIEEADEDVKAELEVKEEEEAVNEVGPDVVTETPAVVKQEAAASGEAHGGAESDAKPKRGRPRKSK